MKPDNNGNELSTARRDTRCAPDNMRSGVCEPNRRAEPLNFRFTRCAKCENIRTALTFGKFEPCVSIRYQNDRTSVISSVFEWPTGSMGHLAVIFASENICIQNLKVRYSSENDRQVYQEPENPKTEFMTPVRSF